MHVDAKECISPPQNLKALLHCQITNALVVEKSEMVQILDPLYMVYFFFPEGIESFLYLQCSEISR